MKHTKQSGRGCRRMMRLFLRGWHTEGLKEERDPTVFLVHHQNMFGPLHALPMLPDKARLWTMAAFFHVRTCWRHFYSFTFRRRFRLPRGLSAIAAGAVALVLPAALRVLRAVPVHRGSRRIGETLRESSRALEQGDSLLICPDLEYSSPSPEMGGLYTGFLHLEKSFYQASGRHLAFTPVYCSAQRKTVIAGPPLRFPDGVPFAQARGEMAARIVSEINRLGRQSGDIIG